MPYEPDDEPLTFDDETSEESTPNEDDAFVETLYSRYGASVHGRHVGYFKTQDEALLEIARICDRAQWWPNRWLVSDHGNLNQITDPWPTKLYLTTDDKAKLRTWAIDYFTEELRGEFAGDSDLDTAVETALDEHKIPAYLGPDVRTVVLDARDEYNADSEAIRDNCDEEIVNRHALDETQRAERRGYDW